MSEKVDFIEAEKANHCTLRICRLLNINRGSYYRALRGQTSHRELKDAELLRRITRVFLEHRRRYGAPRVHRELRAAKVVVGRNRVARLMRENGLFARRARRFVRTTDSDHNEGYAENVLARDFDWAEPDKAWVSDITYLPTRNGWVYLAVILDLYARRVVGYALGSRINADLVLRALDMAIGARGPEAGLIFHSDRGSQYASKVMRSRLTSIGAVQSMSRKGDCWDNAVAESFFATLKTELNTHVFASRQEARTSVVEYIHYYNGVRRHSSNKYVCPIEHEKTHCAEAGGIN